MAEQSFYATGKRKSAVARVWLKPGTGRVIINNKPIDEYIVRETSKMLIHQPLMLTGTFGKLDVYVNVSGGGAERPSRRHQARHFQGPDGIQPRVPPGS